MSSAAPSFRQPRPSRTRAQLPMKHLLLPQVLQGPTEFSSPGTWKIMKLGPEPMHPATDAPER
eukprot:5310599-Pyramimonas_sp.AAC.1